MPAIAVRDLRKWYSVPVRKKGFLGGLRQLVSREKRIIKAVDGISFEIEPGQFIGYVGPNGAGKSTTIKMLTGILHPTSGKIFINGLSPQKQRQTLARQIGVVFGQRTQLWWDLPTIDSFDILAAMYDVSPDEYKRFLKKFQKLLDLDEFLDTPVRKLSLGQRMRADLAGALIHQPSVLFLDEPTIGLDVVAKARIREFLARINKDEGVTILLTTHDLHEIEELCERILVINHGKIIYDGTVEELRDQVNLPTFLRVEYATVPRRIRTGQYIDSNGNLSFEPKERAWRISRVESHSNTVEVSFDRRKSTAPSVLWAMQMLGEIKDAVFSEPPIDEIIKMLLEKSSSRA